MIEVRNIDGRNVHIFDREFVYPVHAVQAHGRWKRMVDSSWNVMGYGDAREGKWRGNWRMEWVASNLYSTSEHGVYSITIADAHTSAASSRLNWRPRRFKWTHPFRRKTKSGFCACAITFQLASNIMLSQAKCEYMVTQCSHSRLKLQYNEKTPPIMFICMNNYFIAWF